MTFSVGNDRPQQWQGTHSLAAAGGALYVRAVLRPVGRVSLWLRALVSVAATGGWSQAAVALIAGTVGGVTG
jgi:hypothetical protein